jgi:hypothetical protein
MIVRGKLSPKEGRGTWPEQEKKAQRGSQEKQSFGEANHVGVKMARELVWSEEAAKSISLKRTEERRIAEDHGRTGV